VLPPIYPLGTGKPQSAAHVLNKQSVDGQHKAGDDDQGDGNREASDDSSLAMVEGFPIIVMASLVPAIHGFLSFFTGPHSAARSAL
jgi:hypothetical protein